MKAQVLAQFPTAHPIGASVRRDEPSQYEKHLIRVLTCMQGELARLNTTMRLVSDHFIGGSRERVRASLSRQLNGKAEPGEKGQSPQSQLFHTSWPQATTPHDDVKGLRAPLRGAPLPGG